MRRSGIGLLVLAASGSALLQGQEKPKTFPSAVHVVTVDVVVSDRKGNAVGGLGRGDFTLLEDGVSQEITSFESVASVAEEHATASGPSAYDPKVSTNAGAPVRPGRTYVVVFDEPHLSSLQAARGKRAVESFLKGMVQGSERVKLIASGHFEAEGARDELLAELPRVEGRRIPDRSPEALGDYEAMRIVRVDDTPLILRVINRIAVLTTGRRSESAEGESITKPNTLGLLNLNEGYIRLLAQNVYHDARTRYTETVETLRGVLEDLGAARGRKSVILVSEGFFKDLESDGYQEVVAAARRANAALYFINVTGLEGIPGETAEHGTYLPGIDQGIVMANQQQDAAGAEAMAADTGGFTIKNRNDIESGFRRIAAETRNYYLLGYSPPAGKPGDKFRKIQVKLKRSGVEVRSRRGYYPSSAKPDAPGADPREATAQIAAAFRSPVDQSGIPLRMSSFVFGEAAPGKVQALIAAEAEMGALSLEERSGAFHGEVDLEMIVAPEAGGEPERFGQKVELNLSPERRDALRARGLPIVRRFDLAPGAYRARLVVHDRGSGRIGSVTHEFEVPGAAFRTSTPVLSDALEGGGSDGGVPVLRARRTFKEHSTLYFQLEVYGAAADPSTGERRVSSDWKVCDLAGQEWASADLSWMRVAPRGAPARRGEVSLTFEPGDYQLVVDVKDAVSGRELTVREPFTVE
jgi:VWFA-related protein